MGLTLPTDPRISAWVSQHPYWTYRVTESGHHEVRDQFGGLQARNTDPGVALKILERR